MTETLQQPDRRIESAEELHSVTRTMRGLAAVNLRHDELAAEAAADFEAVVDDALHVALRDGRIDALPDERPPDDAPTALVVFGSNQGLCGPVNRHVAQHVAAEIARASGVARIGAVGARMAVELELAGLPVDARWDLPGTVEGITPRAEHVLERLDAWQADDAVARVFVAFPRYLGRPRGYEPVTRQLAPTDRGHLEQLARRRWPSRSLPLLTMPWNELVAVLIRAAMFGRLHRSFAQTMAAVSASRLAAMDAAQTNIEERLDLLRTRRHQLRQETITEELLDVVSGFEVLEGES